MAHLHTSFKSLRYIPMVGVAGGVLDTKEDVRLGDVVVSKSTGGLAGVVQYDVNRERAEDQLIRAREVNQPTPLPSQPWERPRQPLFSMKVRCPSLSLRSCGKSPSSLPTRPGARRPL